MTIEFSPTSGRPLPLTAAERARLLALIKRSDAILAKDSAALAEAEALAQADAKAAHQRQREQKRERQAQLLAHLDQTVEALVARHGHWLTRNIGQVATSIRVDLSSLAGAERWSSDLIDTALTKAVKTVR
jgi:class 3 adenylate cyclase